MHFDGAVCQNDNIGCAGFVILNEGGRIIASASYASWDVIVLRQNLGQLGLVFISQSRVAVLITC